MVHGERGQHVKIRIGGAKLRGGTRQVSEEAETIAHALMGTHSSSLSAGTIRPLMQTNARHHRCQWNHGVSRLKQLGLCCARHRAKRRWRRTTSGLLTTTKTQLGSRDTIQGNKEVFLLYRCQHSWCWTTRVKCSKTYCMDTHVEHSQLFKDPL